MAILPPLKERKAAFLEALEKRLEITPSAAAIGVSPKSVFRWREADPEFNKAIMEVQGRCLEVLVASAYDRALNLEGKYDERTAALLTMFMIKAHRPAYKDSFKADIDVGEIKFTFQIPKPEGLGELPSTPLALPE